MSDHSLPKTVDPLKYADQNKVLEGVVTIALMPRLCEMLAESEGEVRVKLEFGRDEQRLRILSGTLKANLILTCERCLTPVANSIESSFTLGIVLTDEQAKNLPRRYEPLLVEPDTLIIQDVIEEELILSLPMFANHEQCEGEPNTAADESANTADTKRENPFSVLSDLNLKK